MPRGSISSHSAYVTAEIEYYSVAPTRPVSSTPPPLAELDQLGSYFAEFGLGGVNQINRLSAARG
jgi:hypothetical protein